jgi:hypothetical protein
MRIRWTDSAIRDFTHICDYIQERGSPAVARRVALSIHRQLDLLESSLSTDELVATLIHANSFSAGYPTLRSIGSTTMLWRSYACFTARSRGRSRPAMGLVAVVMMLFALAHRNHAAVRYFADHVLELDGGVDDPEVVEQAVFHVAQDAFAD